MAYVNNQVFNLWKALTFLTDFITETTIEEYVPVDFRNMSIYIFTDIYTALHFFNLLSMDKAYKTHEKMSLSEKTNISSIRIRHYEYSYILIL